MGFVALRGFQTASWRGTFPPFFLLCRGALVSLGGLLCGFFSFFRQEIKNEIINQNLIKNHPIWGFFPFLIHDGETERFSLDPPTLPSLTPSRYIPIQSPFSALDKIPRYDNLSVFKT